MVTDDLAADSSTLFVIHRVADGWETIPSTEIVVSKLEMEAVVGPWSGYPAKTGLEEVRGPSDGQ